MIRPILKYGATELVTVSAPIEEINGEVRQLAEDMLDTMYAAPGIGLAAPQVGVNIRLIVWDVTAGQPEPSPGVLINPELVEAEGSQKGEEGCLSIPEFTAVVQRPMRIRVRGLDLERKPVELEAVELEARALCHEIDHLDGILYLDRLSRLKRDLIKRKIKRLKKNGEW